MKKKIISLLVLVLLTTLALAPMTSAFNDTKGIKGEKHIQKLKDRGVIKGDSKGKNKFNPKESLTYAQAAVLLDEAFDLSLAHIKFIKEPKASDGYKNVKDDQWYSEAFLHGYHNSLVFAEDVNPNAAISREEFAFHLITQLDRKIEYAMIKIYFTYEDENKVKEKYKNAIQKLLILKFEELDKDKKFNPKKAISREEAAIWLENVLAFIEEQTKIELPLSVLSDITVNREAVSKEVDKVSITATVPHPGYSANISEIKFDGNIAYITLKQINPDADKLYPQVISTITLNTFIDADYKVEILILE